MPEDTFKPCPNYKEVFKPCPNCQEFDSTRYTEIPTALGYCFKMNRILYRFPDYCIDFIGLIPEKIEVVIPSD